MLHQDIKKVDEAYNKFINWFQPRATALVEEHMSDSKNCIVQSKNIDLFQAFLNGFSTDELKQEHNCNTCKRFINGLASFGVIKLLNFGDVVIPFALPYKDEAFDLEVPELYQQPYQNMLNEFKRGEHSLLTNNDIKGKQQVFFGTEMTEGWLHMSLNKSKINRSKLIRYFECNLPNKVKNTDITSTHEWLDQCVHVLANFNIPVVKLSYLDKASLNYIQEVLCEVNEYNVHHVVLLEIRNNGLQLLHIRNSYLGEFIQALYKGIAFDDALGKYTNKTLISKRLRSV